MCRHGCLPVLAVGSFSVRTLTLFPVPGRPPPGHPHTMQREAWHEHCTSPSISTSRPGCVRLADSPVPCRRPRFFQGGRSMAWLPFVTVPQTAGASLPQLPALFSSCAQATSILWRGALDKASCWSGTQPTFRRLSTCCFCTACS